MPKRKDVPEERAIAILQQVIDIDREDVMRCRAQR